MAEIGLRRSSWGDVVRTNHQARRATAEGDPWVADLHPSFDDSECQSTVEFEDERHACEGSADWYVQLEVLEYPVANPLWEGKLCTSCLAGWREWAAMEADVIRVLSVDPVVRGR